jgi:hypothetical protein
MAALAWPVTASPVPLAVSDAGAAAIKRASALTEAARAGDGRTTPPDKRQKDVTILDVFGNTATVKAVMNDWIDYMHEAKFDGQWRIVNVLWEMKPKDPRP